MFRSIQDPLVHRGHHFGCAVHTFCSVQTLVTNGIIHMGEDDMESLAAAYILQLPSTQPVMQTFLVLGSRRSLRYSCKLLKMVPRLEAHLMESSEDNVITISDLVCLLVLLCLTVPLTAV